MVERSKAVGCQLINILGLRFEDVQRCEERPLTRESLRHACVENHLQTGLMVGEEGRVCDMEGGCGVECMRQRLAELLCEAHHLRCLGRDQG